MLVARILAIACGLLLSAPAFSAISDCDSALVIATYNNIESSKSDWRMAKYVDQATYDQIKHDASGSAVIYGVPVGANYSDFQESIKNYTSSHSESFTKEQFRNVSWTGLDPSAAQAYQTCIKGQARGIALIPERATDTDITFRVSYSIIGGSPNPIPVMWSGAEVGNNTLPKTISSGDTIIIIKRPDKSSTLALNSADSSGFSDSVVLTPLPKEDPSEKFATRCNLTNGESGSISRGNTFSWICPALRAGTYSADLTVVPSSDRPVRLGWHVNLALKTDSGEKSVTLKTTSGATIDVDASAGIGTTFESLGNVVDVDKDGSLPIFTIGVDNTYWHGDFSHQSDDIIRIPASVSIKMERK